MLNRIAVSGGTYQDWIQTVYTNEYIERSETPVYQGGYSDEVIFQEVISNSATENEPLGTLAGRGKLQGNNKVVLYGQEVNDKTWAVAQADLLLKGETAYITKGDTLDRKSVV